MTKNSEPNEFLAHIEELIPTLVDKGKGKIALTLESQPMRSGKRQILVKTPNLDYSHSIFCSSSLRNYLTKLPNSKERKAVEILRKSLLDIVNEEGFGSVLLNFKRGKKSEQTIILCETTISRRHVISSV